MRGNTTMEYVKFARIILKNHAQLNERWVQERIANDPPNLGTEIIKEAYQISEEE